MYVSFQREDGSIYTERYEDYEEVPSARWVRAPGSEAAAAGGDCLAEPGPHRHPVVAITAE